MTQNADAIARFNREASNASRLNHPNICSIYDFGETDDGMIYLAMEFVEGRALTDIIAEEGALTPERAASILHQAADALQVAHDFGIVHRDLKPDNIMIAKDRDGADVVKLVDFGIAKAHTSDAQKVTKTGLIVGTPEYMSPEQLAGDKLDGRSDIYSLALVGFNMLTGHLPFPSNSAQEAMIMRLTEDPRTLAEMRPDAVWPRQLQAVIDKALARDAKQRYQKAAEFGREFSMAIEAMPAHDPAEAGTLVIDAAGKKSPIPRTRIDSDADQPVARKEPAATPVARKNAAVMFGVAGFVVVALGGFIAFKTGILGTGSDATTPSGVLPAPADTSGKGVTSPSGSTGSTSGTNQQANAGSTSAAVGPPAGVKAVTPPDTSVRNQPPVPTVSAADLDLLEKWTGGDMDSVSAQRAIKLADQLLPSARGEQLTEVLLRRGTAKLHMEDEKGGCADLRGARDAATARSKLLGAINYLIAQGCPR
jgi:serine/threonine-protein kinase